MEKVQMYFSDVSPYLCISFFNSRDILGTGHVKHMENMRSTYRILYGNLKVGYNLKDLDVDGRRISKWVFK
jgi:hypothetical protein